MNFAIWEVSESATVDFAYIPNSYPRRCAIKIMLQSLPGPQFDILARGSDHWPIYAVTSNLTLQTSRKTATKPACHVSKGTKNANPDPEDIAVPLLLWWVNYIR